MARWLVGVIGVLLLAALFILWNDADRSERSSVDRATATNDNPSKNTGEKPTPQIAKHLAAPVASNQTAANQKTANESETEQKQKSVKLTPPEPMGPLKVLKRVYEDEGRDAKANKIEKQIRDEFGSEYLPVELLRNVVCHKSVCKVEMYWSEKNPLGLMVLSLKMAATLTGHIALDPEPEPDRDGRTLVVVYILREEETFQNLRARAKITSLFSSHIGRIATFPQSRNPQNIPNIPAVSLNRKYDSPSQSGRKNVNLFLREP